MNAYTHPELFDLPNDRRKRRIFRAVGSRLVSPKGAKRKVWKSTDTYVNSPTPAIAIRVARQHFKILRYRLDTIYELTWREYGEVLRRAGVEVHMP